MVISIPRKKTMIQNSGKSIVGDVSLSWNGGPRLQNGIERYQIRLMRVQHLRDLPIKEMHHEITPLILARDAHERRIDVDCQD